MQPLVQWYGVWVLLPRGPSFFGGAPTLAEALVTARAIRRDAVRSPVWIADTRFGAWRPWRLMTLTPNEARAKYFSLPPISEE